MKRIFFAFFVLLIAGSAFAMSTEAPSEIPAHVNWLLTVDFDSTDNFDSANIFLDDEKIVTMYTLANGSGVIDYTNEAVVLKAFLEDVDKSSKEGLILFVSFLGVNEGDHIVKAVIYKNGEQKEEQTHNVKTFSVLPENYKTEIEAQIKQLETLNAELTARIEEIDKMIEAKGGDVNALQEKVESLKETNAGLNSTVSDLQGEVTAMQEEQANQDSGLFGFLNPPAEGTKSWKTTSGTTGLASAKSDSPTLIYLGLFIVIVLVGAALYMNSKRKHYERVYKDFEYGWNDKVEKQRTREEKPEPAAIGYDGRPSFKPSASNENKPHMGELIRKD